MKAWSGMKIGKDAMCRSYRNKIDLQNDSILIEKDLGDFGLQ
jgi:hypothetical protein